jgi:hypothetical protein
MNRPRSFLWVSRNGVPFPQIVYDDPRVGCEGLAIVPGTERKLDPSEHYVGLDTLATKYPAPETV